PSTDPAPATPAGVHRYRLLHPLGWGGTATVYAATDRLEPRTVAVKLIRTLEGGPPIAGDGLLAGRLQHRHVVTVYETGAYAGGRKLADFGLACRRDAAPPACESGFVGTPHFMSPEQCRDEPCDARSDVYALGATYYTLLTGHPPYREELCAHVLFDHCSAAV